MEKSSPHFCRCHWSAGELARGRSSPRSSSYNTCPVARKSGLVQMLFLLLLFGFGKRVTNIFNIFDKKWQAPSPPSFHFWVRFSFFRFSRLSLCSRNKLCEIRSVFWQGPAQHYNTFQHAGKVYCLGLCVSGVCIVFYDATFTLWELFNNKTDPLFSFSKTKTERSFHKTRCQIWCTIDLHRDPISKVLLEW